MAQVSFFVGTKSQYDSLATKSEGALYFLTDVGMLYRGTVPMSHPVKTVTTFPASGDIGTIYVNKSTYEAKTWSGSAWTVLSPSVVTSISSNPTNSQLPTAAAVKSYVDGEITSVNSGVSGAVANVTYASKSISVQKGGGVPVVTQLSGLVDGASYNGSTGVLTLTTNGGTPITVNLPVENFLSAASFNATNNILTLTLNDSTTVTVNLADLVDTYTGANTNGINVTVAANGAISASANISAASGNLLEVKNDGLYAGIEWQSLS